MMSLAGSPCDAVHQPVFDATSPESLRAFERPRIPPAPPLLPDPAHVKTVTVEQHIDTLKQLHEARMQIDCLVKEVDYLKRALASSEASRQSVIAARQVELAQAKQPFEAQLQAE